MTEENKAENLETPIDQSKLNALLCAECDGDGKILQDDGSDSMGTLIACEPCKGTGKVDA